MAIPFGKIEKLYIQAYKDAELSQPAGDKFEALINPETYSYKYKIEFCETQAPGTSGVAMKFNKIPPQEFNFDFLFDGTGAFKGASILDTALLNPLSSTSVADQVESFKHKVFEYNGEKHRPNHLKIILDKYNLLNDNNPKPNYHFYLSDLTKNFEKISKKFFGKTIDLELKVL